METETQSFKDLRKQTTEKVLKLRETTGIDALASLVGLSKVTLYTRIKRGNWKVPEITHISTLD